MPKDDPVPTALVGRAGLVFAYVCFAIAIVALASSIYLLPLEFRAKLFLAAATALVASLFVFMAIAAHLVWRKRPDHPNASQAKRSRKATPDAPSHGADGSQRPR